PQIRPALAGRRALLHRRYGLAATPPGIGVSNIALEQLLSGAGGIGDIRAASGHLRGAVAPVDKNLAASPGAVYVKCDGHVQPRRLIIERKLHLLNKIDLDWLTAAARENSCEEQRRQGFSEPQSPLVHIDWSILFRHSICNVRDIF